MNRLAIGNLLIGIIINIHHQNKVIVNFDFNISLSDSIANTYIGQARHSAATCNRAVVGENITLSLAHYTYTPLDKPKCFGFEMTCNITHRLHIGKGQLYGIADLLSRQNAKTILFNYI